MADEDDWYASGIKGFGFGEMEDARDQLRSMQLDDIVSVDSFASSGSDRDIITYDDSALPIKSSRKSAADVTKVANRSSTANQIDANANANAKPSATSSSPEPRKIEKPKFLKRVTVYGANKRVEFDARQVATALFHDETVYGLDTFKSVSDKRELLEEALKTRDSGVVLRILIHLRKTTRPKVLRNEVLVPIFTSTSGITNVEVQLLTRCATIYFRKLANLFESAPLAFENLADLMPLANVSYVVDCENMYLFEKLAEFITSTTSTFSTKRTAVKNLLLSFPNDGDSGWRRIATAAAHRELQLLDFIGSVQQAFFATRPKSIGSQSQSVSNTNLDWLTHLAARSFLDASSHGPDAAAQTSSPNKNDALKKTLPSVSPAELSATQASISSGGVSVITAIHAYTLMQCTNALQPHVSEMVELGRVLTESIGAKEQLMIKIDSCARTRCHTELDALIQQATKTSFGGLQKGAVTAATILCILANARVDQEVIAKLFRSIDNVNERRALAARLHCDRVLIDLMVEARDRRGLEQFATRLSPGSANYNYTLEVLHRDAPKWKTS